MLSVEYTNYKVNYEKHRANDMLPMMMMICEKFFELLKTCTIYKLQFLVVYVDPMFFKFPTAKSQLFSNSQ